MTPTCHGLSAALFVLSAAALATAQEVTPPEEKDQSREKIVRAAEGFSLSADGKALKMEPAPVLRWPNPTREVPDGATFVWTLDGRPLAIGCVWKFRGLGFAFHSLSPRPRPGDARWQSGLEVRQAGHSLGALC